MPERLEAGRNKTSCKATNNVDGHREGKLQKAQGPAMAAVSEETVRASVDECWPYEGLHLNINYPRVRRG